MIFFKITQPLPRFNTFLIRCFFIFINLCEKAVQTTPIIYLKVFKLLTKEQIGKFISRREISKNKDGL